MLHRPLTRWHWIQSSVIAAGVILLLTIVYEQVIQQTRDVAPAVPSKRWLVSAVPPPEKLLPWGARANEEPLYTSVEEAPDYPGGMLKLFKDVQYNVRYPRAARKDILTGLVLIEVIIEKDGTLSHAYIKRGLLVPASQAVAAQAIHAEALRAVQGLHKRWQPGRQRGRAVRTTYLIPVGFDFQLYLRS